MVSQKDLRPETMEVTNEDYHEVLLTLYKKYSDELKNNEGKYKDWARTAEVYAMSKVDGSGRPVPANIKAFNETVIERRKLSIVIRFLKNEINFIEEFWISKGFNIEELRASVKQKTLLKINPIVKPKEQVADKEHKRAEKDIKTYNNKTLITIKSEPHAERHKTKTDIEEEDFNETAVGMSEENQNDDVEDNYISSAIEDDEE